MPEHNFLCYLKIRFDLSFPTRKITLFIHNKNWEITFPFLWKIKATVVVRWFVLNWNYVTSNRLREYLRCRSKAILFSALLSQGNPIIFLHNYSMHLLAAHNNFRWRMWKTTKDHFYQILESKISHFRCK